MKDFLTKAFTLAVCAYDSIKNTYDYAGYFSMRAIMDSQFLSIDTRNIGPPPLRTAANAYQFMKDKVQSSVLNQVSTKVASGDFGPKPDIKKPLFRALGLVAQNIPRLSLSHSAIVALALGTGLVAAHLMSNGQFTQALSDTTATLIGASPRGRGPSPQV